MNEKGVALKFTRQLHTNYGFMSVSRPNNMSLEQEVLNPEKNIHESLIYLDSVELTMISANVRSINSC